MHWNGFLLPPQLERAWVSSPNGRPCWRPPFPGDTHCPSAGHSAICGHRRAWPQSVDLVLVAQGGMGWGVSWTRKHPRLRPHPHLPTYLRPVPALRPGQGSPWAQRDTNAQGHISGSGYTSTPGQPTLCQLLTQLKASPLVAGRGGVGGTQAVVALLTGFLKELTPLLKKRPNATRASPGCHRRPFEVSDPQKRRRRCGVHAWGPRKERPRATPRTTPLKPPLSSTRRDRG